LLANIALSVLDEHLHRDWLPGGRMASQYQRRKRRRHGQANWRIVRYADDSRSWFTAQAKTPTTSATR